MPDNSEDRVTVWLSTDLRETMDDEHVDWRYESRSQWVREAVETRISLENALSEHDVELPDDPGERAALIESIVGAGVAASRDHLTPEDGG